MTSSEEYLWNILRDRQIEGLKFRRQHPIKGYIADFYCAEYKLIIEVDGGYHSTISQQEYDTMKDELLVNNGYTILRFTNDEISNNIKTTIEAIIRNTKGIATAMVIPLGQEKSWNRQRERGGGIVRGAGLIQSYLNALHRQIDDFASKMGDQEIKTIYFGGGTPSIIGSEELIKLIDHIGQVRNLNYLEELSIEINPDPVDDMLELIQTVSKQYKNFPRVRFSIGIQSFDNEVLEESGRQYNFQACVDFLRKLTKVRMDHNIFNFDFIAFGKFNQTRKGDLQLRDPAKLEFFQNFVESGFADSFSLYTLELFEGSEWFNQQIANHNYEKAGFGLKKYGTDDDVYAEFELLKNIILDAGYQRYEISNYSRSGANSIHNRVYRAMDERLGLGVGATSHLKKDNLEKLVILTKEESLANETVIANDLLPEANEGSEAIHSEGLSSGVITKDLGGEKRDSSSLQSSEGQKEEIYSGHFSIVPDIKRFTTGTRINEKKTELLSENDFLKEKFIMGMRTMDGLQLGEHTAVEVKLQTLQDRQIRPSYTSRTHTTSQDITTILVPNREEKILLYEAEGLCERNDNRFKLTDTGMDVYNSIISELME